MSMNRRRGNAYYTRVGQKPFIAIVGNSRKYYVCERKIPYHVRDAAIEAAEKARERTGENIVPYICEYCGDYHIGHS